MRRRVEINSNPDPEPPQENSPLNEPDGVRCCDQWMEPCCHQLPRGSSDTLEGRRVKSRSKKLGGCSAGIDRRVPSEGEPDEKVARVRLGSYELKKKGHFALRPARSLSPRRCLELAAIPGGLAHTLSFSESRLRRALLGSSRIGGECSAA